MDKTVQQVSQILKESRTIYTKMQLFARLLLEYRYQMNDWTEEDKDYFEAMFEF